MLKTSEQPVDQLYERYYHRFGLSPREILSTGKPPATAPATPLDTCELLVKTRADAVREAIRWGEVYTFYLAPGIISWMVPVVNGREVLGGLIGGEIIADEDADESTSAVSYLVAAGCSQESAHQVVKELPRWSQGQVNTAATFLFDEFYRISGLDDRMLTEHRRHAQQQQQVIEPIHRHQPSDLPAYCFDQERDLLSLIRSGDKPGARKMLKKMLADLFLRCPRAETVQAYAIEVTGYMVRVAMADHPQPQVLMECHPRWINRLLQTDRFETLCWAAREILDEFMPQIFLQGGNRSQSMARTIMDYLAREYKNKLTLEQIGAAVGLSPFRVAHLVKETTGKTVTQHLRLLRIHEAQRLLLQTDMTYTDIAAHLGFSDHSYFIKQFRAIAGTTPARFRRGY